MKQANIVFAHFLTKLPGVSYTHTEISEQWCFRGSQTGMHKACVYYRRMQSVLLLLTPSLNDCSKLKGQCTDVKSGCSTSVRPSLNPPTVTVKTKFSWHCPFNLLYEYPFFLWKRFDEWRGNIFYGETEYICTYLLLTDANLSFYMQKWCIFSYFHIIFITGRVLQNLHSYICLPVYKVVLTTLWYLPTLPV